MSTLPSTHERNRLRHSLVNLASLLVLTLLACGLVSLFALWSMERLHARTEVQQTALLQALNNARSAQVAFKIQVQSWKNLLLRGAVASDYDTAFHEFEASEATTNQGLQAVTHWAQSIGNMHLAGRIHDVIDLHANVGKAYRASMPTPTSMIRQRDVADAAVRGIDRPLNKGLDELVEEMLATDVKVRQEARDLEHERFGVLSRVIWLSLGLSLLLVSSLLWRTLRDPALRK
jgi:hypothetical protein